MHRPNVGFQKKDQDTLLMKNIEDKYDFFRDTKVFSIASINDHNARFAANILATKLVQKM